MADWIAIIEAAYRLDGGLEDWLASLAGSAAPLLDRGHGTVACAFVARPQGFSIDHLTVAGGPSDGAELARRVLLESPARTIEGLFRGGVPAGSMSDILRQSTDSAEVARALRATSGRYLDGVGCIAHAGSAAGVALMSPLSELGTMAPGEQARWRRVALHTGSAYRLRRAIGSLLLDDDSVEAILDPDGRVRDARGSATGKSAREALRQAALRAERARGALRRQNGDEALALWEGLVRGRWSLVDQFDTDGRRYLVARPNVPGAEDPRGLADRELQTAEFLGFGYAPKEIAYALGLAPSTVANALRRARTKLGLHSQTELAAFFAPGGIRQRLVELELAGETMAIGSIPLLGSELLERLTEAERLVAVQLVQGATNREIAERRNTSDRTIANQVQSIFRKLELTSRSELAVALRSEHHEAGAIRAAGRV